MDAGAGGAAKMGRGFWRGKRWLAWTAGAVLAALAVTAAVVLAVLHRAEPILRARIVEELEEHFHARVELDSFHVSLASGLWAEGKGLRIWPADQTEGAAEPGSAGRNPVAPGAPLIRLDEFRFHAPLRYAPGKPIRISVVDLKGLTVDVPPKSHWMHAAADSGSGKAKTGVGLLDFSVDSIECTGAHLIIETAKPGKLPLEFDLLRLKLTHVSMGGAMQFQAELTNPRPVGTIVTAGSFGPWVVDDPGQSAVEGTYTFSHADLSGFKGIAGILSSTGRYQGTLRNLTVDGETDTPDFRLTHFGNALPLHTQFHAKVDGTNGDTWLEPVEATLAHSHFTAQGKIVGVPGKGHDIALTVSVDRGRMEDFLRLASHSQTPLLTGALTLKTALEIPPGPAPVHERLKLNGSFALDDARFTSAKIQGKIDDLSLRGQGRPRDVKNGGASVRSTMRGDFTMAGGVITLPRLIYTVPGAEIDLKGTYGIENGSLNFAGTAKMQATVSQMVGGLMGVLLKPADRFFKKDGAGTEVPIHIGGTRKNPDFGIDFGRMKSTSAQRPGGTQ
jgi:hypothetical protein